MTNQTSTSLDYEELRIEESEKREAGLTLWFHLARSFFVFSMLYWIYNFFFGINATEEKRISLILPMIVISLSVFGFGFWKSHLSGKIKNERDLQALYRAQIAGKQPSSK